MYALAELPSGSVEHGMGDAEMESLVKELVLAADVYARGLAAVADAVAARADAAGWQYQLDARSLTSTAGGASSGGIGKPHSFS